MTWSQVTLGDLFKIKHGFAFKSEHFSNEGEFVLLTPGNFHEKGGFRRRVGKDRYFTGDIPEAFVLNAGDLIIAMTEQGPGLLGSSALIPETETFLHNQRIGLIHSVDEAKLDLKFLFYLFNTAPIRGQINASATGTKVRHTAPERIYRISTAIPDLADQKRIAGTLSTYDDLIENNRRRIALLEDAARQLYKEWFVRFRFPGHEHVKVANGMPDGWQLVAFRDIAVVKKGKNITKDSVTDGEVPVVAGGLSPAYYHGSANVLGSAVTISASGANAGFTNYYQQDIWASDCSYLAEADNDNLRYLYLLLKHRQIDLTAMQKGAAQPHVYPKDVERLEVLDVPARLIQQFSDLIDPVFDQVTTLQKQNHLLARARDLLLPKLMNGTLTV